MARFRRGNPQKSAEIPYQKPQAIRRNTQAKTPPAKTPRQRIVWLALGKVEAIEIHDLVPCSHEIPYKRVLRVITGVDFRNGSELGVRAEYEIDAGGGPLAFAC